MTIVTPAAVSRDESAPAGAPAPSTVRLSAAVMTHPARVGYAEQMRDRHPELGLEIVVDPAPGEGIDALRTARLAWDAVAPDATHHLVLQDDTVLCPAFRDHLVRAITAGPDRAIVLYAEWGCETSYAVRLAALHGSAWADVVDDYVPTQALVLPADLARAFSGFSGYSGPHDDFAMHPFLASVGATAEVTVPNLAEDAQLSSIVGHEYMGERASVCFAHGEPGDPGWSTPATAPVAVPAFTWAVGHPYWLVRADGPGQRWRRESPWLAMRRYGQSAAAVGDLWRATVRRWPAHARAVGPNLLFGLWLTAYGLGLAAADLIGPDPAELDQAMARPTVRRALATMPHGALRFLIDDQQRGKRSNELYRLVEFGVRQGYEALNHRGPAPSRHAGDRRQIT